MRASPTASTTVTAVLTLLLLLPTPAHASNICCNTTTGACTLSPGSCPAGQINIGTGNSCSPNPCMGACCPTAGTGCSVVIVLACAGFFGDAQTCATMVCPLNACCDPNTYACVISNSGLCPAGTSAAPSSITSCTPNPCTPMACCNSTTGACTLAVATPCPAGTTAVPSVSVCAPNLCSGRCCNRWTGNCVVTDNATCTSFGLRFDGPTSTCSSTTCRACPADYDGSGQLQVADIFAYLNSWFAGCP
jgi:hypothetical protein